MLDLSDAGIVDEDVDGAEVVFDGGDETINVGREGDVGLQRNGPAAEALDFGADVSGGGVLFAVVDGEVGAGSSERDGDGTADAAAGAGDESYAIEEL